MLAIMSDLTRTAAKRFGDRIAMSIVESDEAVSFAQIDDWVGRYAGGLAASGVKSGDRVVIHMANGVGWVVVYNAIARLGAIIVPANILLAPAEVAFIAADSQASAIVLSSNRTEAISEAMANGDSLPAMIVHDDSSSFAIPPAMLDHPYQAPASVAPDDLFTIGYTSGTTGQPKGAMQTHEAVFLSTAMTATIHVRNAQDRVLTALPFPHVYGNVVMNAAFMTGSCLYVMPRFDAGTAIETIGTHRITLFEGVPTMYFQMLSHPRFVKADFTSLLRCTVGGQTIPVTTLREVSDKMGCPILELWGMTEVAGPATTHSPYWPARLGTIGLPFPGVEVRVADLEDPTLTAPHGQAGELCIRGPLVTRGYWQNPEATRSAIDADGWLATGDIAVQDADGYLKIVDRRKDLIITAGYNIYPAELEQVIAMHPAVAMVAVAPVEDAEKGELAKAFIVLRPGAQCDEAALAAHCRQHLASYKQPRSYTFVEDLPRTSTGKIMRRALRTLIATSDPIH